MDIQKDEAFELAFLKTNFYKGMVESLKNKECPFESVFEIRNGKYRSSYVQLSHEIWQAAKANAVPDLSDLQERIAGHQYYHDDHGHMIVDMDDVVKEIGGFNEWKDQAVPEATSIGDELQSWVAVNSFAASDAVGDFPVIDANALAEVIEKLTGASQ